MPRPPNPRGRPRRLTYHPLRERPEQRRERAAARRSLRRELSDLSELRPQVRGDCHRVRLRIVEHLPPDDPYRVHRPCPFVACRFHLHVDVDREGVVTVVGGGIAHTCVLDSIDERGALEREQIAEVLEVSEERTRVLEVRLLRRIRRLGALAAWEGHQTDAGDNGLDE